MLLGWRSGRAVQVSGNSATDLCFPAAVAVNHWMMGTTCGRLVHLQRIAKHGSSEVTLHVLAGAGAASDD